MADGSKKLIQPDVIKRLENVFGEVVSNVRDTPLPMQPGNTVVRPTDEEELLDAITQREYRSGVGMLLYLVKHSRPDLSNPVRELSKVMDGATSDHVKNLYKAIKYVLSTKSRGIVMTTKQEDGVVAYVDSDYAGDRENRRLITGYIIYLYGVPIAWKSKQQVAAKQNLTLSVKSEWI
jgi:hypothetical protein